MNKSFLETTFKTHTHLFLCLIFVLVSFIQQKGDNSLCMKLPFFLQLRMPNILLHLWPGLSEPSNINVKSAVNIKCNWMHLLLFFLLILLFSQHNFIWKSGELIRLS